MLSTRGREELGRKRASKIYYIQILTVNTRGRIQVLRAHDMNITCAENRELCFNQTCDPTPASRGGGQASTSPLAIERRGDRTRGSSRIKKKSFLIGAEGDAYTYNMSTCNIHTILQQQLQLNPFRCPSVFLSVLLFFAVQVHSPTTSVTIYPAIYKLREHRSIGPQNHLTHTTLQKKTRR